MRYQIYEAKSVKHDAQQRMGITAQNAESLYLCRLPAFVLPREGNRMRNCNLLLFDLDGTLLRSDKTISPRTLSALKKAREKGILIGVSTSRSE